MIIEKYGIQLKRIAIEDIELIREKRNSVGIASKMIHQQFITPEQQIKWFESINNTCNFYYLIVVEGSPIGLINDKNINWENQSSEAGLFIWETNYLNTIIPSLATLCLLELGFEVLSWNKTMIKILLSNKEALAYNKQIGFKITAQKEGVVFMEITRTNYNKKARKIISTLTKLQEHMNLKVTINNHDIELLTKMNNVINPNHQHILIQHTSTDTIFEYKITF